MEGNSDFNMTTNKEDNELRKINLGCGLNAPSGWVNIDASYTARLSKWNGLYKAICKIGRKTPIAWPNNIKSADVRKGLSFEDGSIEAIFSSHMIEHMSFDEGKYVIKECHRCLRDGGVLKIITPDLFQMAQRYIDSRTVSPEAKHSSEFLESLGISQISYKGIRKLIHEMLSHRSHKYMYDESSLRELLEKTGFKNIQRVSYGESQISDIAAVEEEHRYEMSICLEGTK